MTRKTEKGISLLEVIIAVAIISILASIVIARSSSSSNTYELKRVSRDLVSLLSKARVQSAYSDNASKYSVKLFTNKAVLFSGVAYTEGASTNETLDFGTKVSLATTSLAISTSTISFDRITGKTSNYGEITLWLTSATTSSTTINVGKTGIIDLQ